MSMEHSEEYHPSEVVNKRAVVVAVITLGIVALFVYAGLSSSVDNTQDRELAEEIARDGLPITPKSPNTAGTFDSTSDSESFATKPDIGTVGLPVETAVRTLEKQSDALDDQGFEALIDETDGQLEHADQLVAKAGLSPASASPKNAASSDRIKKINTLQDRLAELQN